jgi:uncharacterized protein YyaL (SSP411 family)
LRWLKEALALTDRMIEEFWDDESGGFYFTGKSHESLIVRSKDYFDNATPSGNSVAAMLLVRLAALTGRDNYRNLATAVLREIGDQARRYPSGFGYALSAVDFLLSTPKEVAIVGKDATDIGPLLAETWRRYIPNKVVAPGFGDDPEAGQITPLLANRALSNNLATAYVCENFTCKLPVTNVSELSKQL